jgi:Fur family ferric uptake transcriptional regulator
MARKPLISPALLILMERQERHTWTLEDLHAGLTTGGSTADFSTVYRAAEKLVADGIARKVLLNDGRARFELPGMHHDHLHCTGCDELIAVPCVIDRKVSLAIESATGAAILDHNVVLSGLCPKCAGSAR